MPTILLVDEEPAITENLAPLLRHAGFEVAVAQTGDCRSWCPSGHVDVDADTRPKAQSRRAEAARRPPHAVAVLAGGAGSGA